MTDDANNWAIAEPNEWGTPAEDKPVVFDEREGQQAKPVVLNEADEQAAKAKLKNALATVLEGRSDKFKAIVLEMAYRNKWDINDPSFLIVCATGQLEALLQQYPAEFAVLLNSILEDAEDRWAALQQEWIHSVGLARETSKEFEGHITKLETATDQQIALLDAKSEELIAKGFALAQAHTVKQIEAMAKGLKPIHYIQAVGYSCLAAAAFGSLCWTGGWMSRGWLDRASLWGNIQQWNRDELRVCLEAGQNTCQFQVKPQAKQTLGASRIQGG